MSYFIKDLGDSVQFGLIEGTQVSYAKTDLYYGFASVCEILGEEEATQVINSLPAELFVGTQYIESCGSTSRTIGDVIPYLEGVVCGITTEFQCGGHKKETVKVVGKKTFTIPLDEGVNAYLVEKFLPKSALFFKVATYSPDGDIYISTEGQPALYCSWENIKNKDFDACLWATDDYYNSYYSTRERYEEFYSSKMHKPSYLDTLKGLITHTTNVDYLKYINKRSKVLRKELDDELEALEKKHKEEGKVLWDKSINIILAIGEALDERDSEESE